MLEWLIWVIPDNVKHGIEGL